MFAILIVMRIIVITFRGGQRKPSGENFGDNGRRKLELNKQAPPAWDWEGIGLLRERPCGLFLILFINHVFVWVCSRRRA